MTTTTTPVTDRLTAAYLVNRAGSRRCVGFFHRDDDGEFTVVAPDGFVSPLRETTAENATARLVEWRRMGARL